MLGRIGLATLFLFGLHSKLRLFSGLNSSGVRGIKMSNNNFVISVFGASRSSTTILHFYNLGKFIRYIYDDNLQKV